MKSKILIEIENPHEIARLLNLIEDGRKILEKQDRVQRGIDGYTINDLNTWKSILSKFTNVKCEFAKGDI